MAKASFPRYQKLIDKAKEAAKFAYAPYSKVLVGAALYTVSRKIYTGVNVENSSYGLTMCAERVAVSKAVSDGETSFRVLVLYSKEIDFIIPCGACLQVLGEFSPNLTIFTFGPKDRFRVYPLKELLHRPFKLRED